VLSDAPRLKITNIASAQEIAITAFSLAELETDGFLVFLDKAVSAFLGKGNPGKLKKASEL
jgi:hypothetical protein